MFALLHHPFTKTLDCKEFWRESIASLQSSHDWSAKFRNKLDAWHNQECNVPILSIRLIDAAWTVSRELFSFWLHSDKIFMLPSAPRGITSAVLLLCHAWGQIGLLLIPAQPRNLQALWVPEATLLKLGIRWRLGWIPEAPRRLFLAWPIRSGRHSVEDSPFEQRSQNWAAPLCTTQGGMLPILFLTEYSTSGCEFTYLGNRVRNRKLMTELFLQFTNAILTLLV